MGSRKVLFRGINGWRRFVEDRIDAQGFSCYSDYMWVWVDFIVWRSVGASRVGPGGGGTMFAVCLVTLVRMVCFIWRLGLVRVRWWR